jgi:hypothetical protein
VIGQCFAIAQELNCEPWKKASDLVIEPDVNGYKYDDFEHSAELIRGGELVARAALPTIRKWLQPQSLPSVRPQPSAWQQRAALPAD